MSDLVICAGILELLFPHLFKDLLQAWKGVLRRVANIVHLYPRVFMDDNIPEGFGGMPRIGITGEQCRIYRC